MKNKIIMFVSVLMMFLPWTILPLRSLSWALESPVAEIMIAGYAVFMICSGIFTAVCYGMGRIRNTMMKICLVVNGCYAAAGVALIGMMFV